jgi:hypothetical protein
MWIKCNTCETTSFNSWDNCSFIFMSFEKIGSRLDSTDCTSMRWRSGLRKSRTCWVNGISPFLIKSPSDKSDVSSDESTMSVWKSQGLANEWMNGKWIRGSTVAILFCCNLMLLTLAMRLSVAAIAKTPDH